MMLIDQKLDARAYERFPNVMKFIANAKPRMRRFLISDEVIVQIATLMRDYPELMVRNFQFAIPPYDAMYIDFNAALYIDTLGAVVLSDLERDTQLGLVIDQNKIAVIAQSNRSNNRTPKPTPYIWSIDGSGFHSAFHQFPWENIEMQLSYAFGTTYSKTREIITDEMEAEFSRRFRLWYERGFDFPNFRKFIPYIAGELRTFLSILLWINQPSMVDYEHVSHRRVLVRGRPTVYAAHSIVRLRKDFTIKKAMAHFTDRAPPRRHEVRGFWRHYHLTQGCEHDWDVMPDESGHWHCKTCKGMRTWIKSHLRGDASRGFITKEYKT